MFPSGVTAVCAIVDGAPVGVAASSFTSVSLDPPLVSVCMAHTSTTWPTLRSAPRIGVSVLGGHHGGVARQLAARGTDRFADVTYEVIDGAIVLPDAAMSAVCSLEHEFTAGDHVIAVLRVHTVDPHPEVKPIVFHASEFRELAG
ncbi:flavin reductase family protein [Actinomadura rayongensis]|nr:flavin reductase family protein [Actinomadura rayongensis]